jgi:hypothetical protein
MLILHSVDLPDDLFVEGETKPKRKKKAKPNKRSFHEMDADVGGPSASDPVTAESNARRVRTQG